ncbi:hypothetical protein D915_001112 [Fasciola hepatica]|uniref:Uncharacterized protein n=1 Tax=Fasciola hepatica TaxID=6192 RepID=A0A4E0S3U3_FASHE|nr:hypothetical protein D915_001112 [Fasciola hepatica]
MIAGEQVLPAEQACLQQAKDHMCEFARGLGVPLFFQLPEALKYVRTSVMEHRELREKRSRRKFCSISSVEQQFIERVLRVRKVFNSLKPSKFGTVSVEQAHSGLQHLKTNFPCHSAFHEHTMKTLNFEQFSMAFACYVFQHSRAQSNSSSVSAALHPAGLTLRHSRSMYGHREGNWAPRVLRPLTSTVSVDQDDSGNLSDETSLRQQRFSQSMSFGGQSELTETSSPSFQLNAFKSWINGFRKRRVLSPDRFPDEPNCTAAYDLYVCGSLSGDFSLLDHNALSLLRLPANQPMSVFFADHPAQQLGSNVASTNPKRARVWARNHSRLLLYIVDSYSFSLSTMIEAAFAMGSGLPVVLCVNQLQVNEMVVQWSGEKRYPHVFHSTSVSHDPSSRIDYITGKTVRPDRHIESTTRIKSDSAQSSTSAFSSSWVKQASYPNDEIAGFTSSDMSSNGGESNSGSATASPACPGVNSILNPSVDSGLGLNTDSTELLDEHSDLDGSCIVSDSLHRCSAAHEKSASVSPVREKSVLPNLWEDSIFSMIVSNTAAKDHNRGRVYLTSIAQMMHIPVTSQIQEALDWCKTRLSAWPSSSSPTHLCTLPCD